MRYVLEVNQLFSPSKDNNMYLPMLPMLPFDAVIITYTILDFPFSQFALACLLC